MIEISENEYALLREHTQQHIRHQFDNTGNWIHRSQLIEEAVECGLEDSFIQELSSDAWIENKREEQEYRQSEREFKSACIG